MKTKIIDIVMNCIDSNVRYISSRKTIESQKDEEISDHSHLKVITKDTNVYTLFDSGS